MAHFVDEIQYRSVYRQRITVNNEERLQILKYWWSLRTLNSEIFLLVTFHSFHIRTHLKIRNQWLNRVYIETHRNVVTDWAQNVCYGCNVQNEKKRIIETKYKKGRSVYFLRHVPDSLASRSRILYCMTGFVRRDTVHPVFRLPLSFHRQVSHNQSEWLKM